MSSAQLMVMRPRLQSIPTADVYAPELPVPTILQEANELLTFIGEKSIWQTLTSIGVEPSARDLLEQAIGATRAAQSQWTVVRDRQKSDAQREREERAQTERADLMAACRYHLRDDPVAQGKLSLIAEGEGAADLGQDLNDLATLIERKQVAFENDKTFDVAERVERARSLSSEVSAGTCGERLETDQASAIDLRDRAYTFLDRLVTRLREAGRYAFRNDEHLRKRFASSYLGSKKKRHTATRSNVAAAPAVGRGAG
jgi:hypothetical protein